MLPGDLIDYIETCEHGRYYGELACVLGLPFGTPDEKRAVKVTGMILAMGRHRPKRKHWRAFSARWPSVAATLERLKQGDYRNAAHTLQRRESNLMVVGVCGSLVELHPHIPIVTIHDSILTRRDDAEVVGEMIRRTWRSAGVTPYLKSKPA